MRRLLLLVALCLALAVAAATAEAATRHTIRGAGWGHGLGLSQYGAYGYARHGWDYRQIVRHFYTGTQVGEATSETIRVLLRRTGAVRFSGATRVRGRRSLNPNRTYITRPTSTGVQVRALSGRRIGTFPAPLVVDGEGQPVRLYGRPYRGALEIRGGYTVNALDIDDYVQGVVPDEMPASWHMEALKAQALAARSYAMASDAGGRIFDQFPDTRSQVYGGVNAEESRSNQAIRATEGEVIRHNGRVITAFFFSTSGGHTENIENVWRTSPQPYLKGVESPYESFAPRHRWRFSFSTGQMQARLGGLVKGRFRRIAVLRRGVSPRIVTADVVGSRGRTRVSGSTLRARLGVYDNWMHFGRVSTSAARASRGAPVEPRMGARTSTWPGRSRPARWLYGEVSPAPADGQIVVERRGRGGRWRVVRRALTYEAGAYTVRVPGPGVFRVRADGFVGPTVRVR
jgi:stage II sporulation protein D